MKCAFGTKLFLTTVMVATLLDSAPIYAAQDWSDAKLLQFLDELVAYIDDHHVVRDPTALTYGMNYEFYDPKTNRKIQDFGLDTMHDGAWFATSLLAARRAYPEGGYLARALKYELPFYVSMLNHSDVLFPDKVERQDKKEIVEPLKGWAPRGWDEGIGYDFVTGERFGQIEWSTPKADQVTVRRKGDRFWYSYYTPSNHLLQDLAELRPGRLPHESTAPSLFTKPILDLSPGHRACTHSTESKWAFSTESSNGTTYLKTPCSRAPAEFR